MRKITPAVLVVCFILAVALIRIYTPVVLGEKGLAWRWHENVHPADPPAGLVLLDYAIAWEQKGIVEVSFYVANRSRQDMRNFSFLCEFQDGNGRYLGKQYWSFHDTLPAEHKAPLQSVSRRYLPSQAKTFLCFLLNAEPLPGEIRGERE